MNRNIVSPFQNRVQLGPLRTTGIFPQSSVKTKATVSDLVSKTVSLMC